MLWSTVLRHFRNMPAGMPIWALPALHQRGLWGSLLGSPLFTSVVFGGASPRPRAFQLGEQVSKHHITKRRRMALQFIYRNPPSHGLSDLQSHTRRMALANSTSYQRPVHDMQGAASFFRAREDPKGDHTTAFIQELRPSPPSPLPTYSSDLYLVCRTASPFPRSSLTDRSSSLRFLLLLLSRASPEWLDFDGG